MSLNINIQHIAINDIIHYGYNGRNLFNVYIFYIYIYCFNTGHV